MSAQSNIDCVHRIYTAISNGDTAEVLSYFDEQTELVEPESLPYGGTYRGLSAIGAAIGKMIKFVDMQALKVERILADDEIAVAFVTATWRFANGHTRKIALRECYTFKDGKVIAMNVFYWDVAALLVEPDDPLSAPNKT